MLRRSSRGGFGQYPLKFYFLEGSESVPYAKAWPKSGIGLQAFSGEGWEA